MSKPEDVPAESWQPFWLHMYLAKMAGASAAVWPPEPPPPLLPPRPRPASSREGSRVPGQPPRPTVRNRAPTTPRVVAPMRRPAGKARIMGPSTFVGYHSLPATESRLGETAALFLSRLIGKTAQKSSFAAASFGH